MSTNQQEESAWWRAEFLTHNPEPVSGKLWGMGAGGVEIKDRETFFEGDPSYAPIPDGKARVVAFFEITRTRPADILVAELERWCDGDVGVDLVGVASFEDTSWKTKWRDYFKHRHLSPRVIVGPPWEEFDAPEGGHKMLIEPGMAFGTGTHETTQVVATMLDEWLDQNPTPRLLDVGCGSGILSMLAAQLGVSEVLGVDIDGEALENARHNLGLNGLEDANITYATTPTAEVEGQWPLVVANILAHILIALRDALVARCEPGGQLILSGIIEAQLEDIRRAFIEEAGLIEEDMHVRGEWYALRLTRPA